MKITDGAARFVCYEVEISDGLEHDGITTRKGDIIERFRIVATLAEAHGVWIDCPLCTAAGSPHGVLSWFPNAPLHPDTDLGKNNAGQSVRWTPGGTGLEDLSLSPSIQIQGGCNWHGWVVNGETRDA